MCTSTGLKLLTAVRSILFLIYLICDIRMFDKVRWPSMIQLSAPCPCPCPFLCTLSMSVYSMYAFLCLLSFSCSSNMNMIMNMNLKMCMFKSVNMNMKMCISMNMKMNHEHEPWTWTFRPKQPSLILDDTTQWWMTDTRRQDFHCLRPPVHICLQKAFKIQTQAERKRS